MALDSGKLSPAVLTERVLRYLGTARDDVLIHAGLGEDSAAIAFGDEACVISSDPITGAGDDAGWYAVHVAANDVAATGAEPVGVLLTVLLPISTTEQQVESLMRQADRAARELGLEILGGHTEITSAVVRPVICTTAVGRVRHQGLIQSGGAQPGQALIMTKTAGLEGTAILAGDFPHQLDRLVGPDLRRRAAGLKASLSVVAEGLVAARAGASAMHDATEGGVLGAAYEMAAAAGAGIELWADRVPVAEETRTICAALSADPLRLVASGSMLIAGRDAAALVAAVEQIGVRATEIGRIVDRSRGMTVVVGGESRPLPRPEGDELWRRRPRLDPAKSTGSGGNLIPDVMRGEDDMRLGRGLGLVAVGGATGLVNGLLGIGGGSFLVPMLVFLLGMSEHDAHGTSLATILPTSCISAAIYASRQLVDYRLAAYAAAGGAVGAYVGARLMTRLSPPLLRRLFASFLAVAALRMLLAGAVR